MAWNYRVLREEVIHNNEKLKSYRVVEVFYNEQGLIEGYADCTDTILHIVGHPYKDLEQTAKHVQHAFQKPLLALDEDGKLYELAEEEKDVEEDIELTKEEEETLEEWLKDVNINE